jgi:16S rRNA (cytosine967-C5)-methyltransferase
LKPAARSGREAAFATLCRWDPLRHKADDLLADATRGLPPRETTLAHHLVEECLRHLRLLDHWIAALTCRPDGRPAVLDTATTAALRLGLVQLHALRVPAHAAVSTSVDLTPPPARGLANAVLRRFDRERDTWHTAALRLPPQIRHSIPDPLWQRWVERLGPDSAATLAASLRRPARLILMPNRLHPDHPTVLTAPALRPLPDTPGFFTSDSPVPPQWFAGGLICAMDPAADLAPRLLAPRPGEAILDACAAPGGKTRRLAELAHDAGGETRLTATDADPARLARLRDNLARWRVTATTLRIDFSIPNPSGPGPFDAALVDAPCTNTGVLRRRLDARYRFNPGTLARATLLQAAILDHVAPLVRPGGRLVYSTCSLEPEENQHQITAFLARHPAWHLAEATSAGDPLNGDSHFAALLHH